MPRVYRIALVVIITVASLLAGPASAQPKERSEQPAQPVIKSDPIARKHVRGCPVEQECKTGLAAGLREFELQAFPRGKGKSPWMKSSRNRAPGASAQRRDRKATEIRPDLPWLDKLKMPGFKVRWDERIIKYLEFYKNDRRGRNIMGAWLRDQGKWRSMILPYLRAAKLPDDLLYVCMIESSYDSLEYSRAGASGLWQFMRHGGRVYGLRIDRWVDERNDPVRSTQAVLNYWTDLHQRFGDWDLAMAAFNAGYAGVLRSIAKYNTNDFWTLVDYENALPWGSSIYVPKALAAAIVGHNRELFGYQDIVEAAPIEWDNVEVPRSVSLRTIARAAGVSRKAVQDLNPQLRRGRTPPGTRRYVLRVPKGSGELFTARFGRMRSEWDVHDEYNVRHGERFEDIAARYGISRSKLRRLNGVSHDTEIAGGMTLIVPRLSAERTRENHRRAMDKLYAGGHPKGVPGDRLIVAVPKSAKQPRKSKRVFYRVVAGDSQSRVATAFGLSRHDLARWNGLDPEGHLHARMVLQLFVSKKFNAAKHKVKLLDSARLHVVERGTPEHIAASEHRLGRARVVYRPKKPMSYAQIGALYGMSDRDLARINRQRRKTIAKPGDKVIVYKVVNRRKSERAAKQARKANQSRRKATKGKAKTRKRVTTKKKPSKPAKAKAKPAKKKAKAKAKPAKKKAKTKSAAGGKPSKSAS